MFKKDCEEIKKFIEEELLRLTSLAYFKHLDIKIDLEECINGEYKITII